MKVVSLVPSITELLVYLNVDVIGRTKFCVFPKGNVEKIPKIGGTKTVDVDKVIKLNPDLVIANKEENVKEQIEALTEAGYEVLTTEISNFDNSLNSILDIGNQVARTEKAKVLVENIKLNFRGLVKADKSVCYLIWRNPYMTVGGDTFISSMLDKCGWENVFSKDKRYPIVSVDDIKSASPDLIFLSSEPFPFSEEHLEELQSKLPECRILLVDGTFFSWYGSRLLDAASYFQKALYSQLN